MFSAIGRKVRAFWREDRFNAAIVYLTAGLILACIVSQIARALGR